MNERMFGHAPADPTAEAIFERLTRMSPMEADVVCDQQIARAIERWRLTEATEWHRLKLRLRWRRAMQARGVEPKAGGGNDIPAPRARQRRQAT